MNLDLTHLPSTAYILGSITGLFSVINPPSSASMFASAVASMDDATRIRTARRAAFTAVVAMLLFATAGQVIFSFFGFTALAMRLVGGVLLLYRSIHIIYGEDHSAEDEEAGKHLPETFAIIPFGIPILAGPGTLSAVMSMIAGTTTLEYLVVILAIFVNGWICYQFMAQAPRILRLLGPLGTQVLSKIMGLILAAVAMQFLINGTKGLVAEVRAMPAAVAPGS